MKIRRHITLIHFIFFTSLVLSIELSIIVMSIPVKNINGEYIRPDGVKMNYDPYSREMIEKYGAPGETDHEGFDPYRDTVGAGIYGGRVKRDERGNIMVGRQYQDHATNPGPIYAGGGYTPMSNALRSGEKEIGPLLDKFPDLVNEITTGGATPLHMCGMGSDNQHSTAYIISRGGDIEALDTYGYKPLHRMASNNLAIGAQALLEAGAKNDETAMSIAKSSGALDVINVLKRHSKER